MGRLKFELTSKPYGAVKLLMEGEGVTTLMNLVHTHPPFWAEQNFS